MTDLELAQAAADCYESGASWEHVWQLDDVWVATRRNGSGERVIAFRGSRTVEDWLRDLTAMPTYLKRIGWVHKGFSEGMIDVLNETRSIMASEPVWISGHSLGAARAWIYAALVLTARNVVKPAGVATIGTPRPGFPHLRKLVAKSGIHARAYANKGDPVCDVPLRIPFIWPYCEPVDPIEIDVAPDDGADGPLARHHAALYVKGVSALSIG